MVSRIGFGCMPLSTEGRPVDEKDSIRVIHSVLDAGVTLLDTSNAYCIDDNDIGHNERLVAKALQTWPGDKEGLVVATKGGRNRPNGKWGIDGRPESLKRACEQSLKALSVERIDLYTLNIPDPNVPFEDSIGALAELQHEGKIRWIGLSNVTVEQIEAARLLIDVIAVQNRFNVYDRDPLSDGVLSLCENLGIGFLAWYPMGGWWLSQDLAHHKVLKKIARRRNVSPHAVALAWLIGKSPSVIPIPGSRRVANALDCTTAANLDLDRDELTQIDQAKFSSKRSFSLRLRGLIKRTVGKAINRSQ